MAWFKKALFLSVALLLILSGLWLVIVNDTPTSLNLLFVQTPELNVGFLVLCGFALGALVGLTIGLSLFTRLKLSTELMRLKRERKQLQGELVSHRTPLN